MKQLKLYWQGNSSVIGWTIFICLALGMLLLYHLGSLTHGLSYGEVQAATVAVGWHGIYHAPLDLPLKAIRSVVFYIFPTHGQTLTRLPNAFFGALAIISFGWLTWLWHGRRTALLVSALFATSAWVLHVSRLASYDVLYLWSITTLLLTHALLYRYPKQTYAWYGVLAFWGLLLTIPGMIWFLLPELFLQRAKIKTSWKRFSAWWQRLLAIVVPLIWVPLIGIDLSRKGQLITWLGLPSHLAKPAPLFKQFIGIFVHLFIRGPQYPTLWLGKAPMLDAFTLAMAALGIYFYASRWQSGRSQLLEIVSVIGIILVTLQGPVGLSVLVPVVYVAVAMGIAYLIHEWLYVFPINPLARRLGISLVTLVVAASCIYNLRAYFVAWANSPLTLAIFRYHR
jgi:hypothetical protein